MSIKCLFFLFVSLTFLLPTSSFAQWAEGHGPKNINGNNSIIDYSQEEKKESEKDIIPDDNCHNPERINFPLGKTETIVSGGVTRENSFCYIFFAKKRQTIKINLIDSTENMSVIVFYPKWKYRKLVQGGDVPDGDSVKNLEISGDKAVQTVLSESGNYLIVMALNRGGAGGYKMKIKIQ